MRRALLLVFLLGAAVRAIDVDRPVNGSIRAAWRECDVAAIARNFEREGMNILYPRIDWRGTGPGYTQSEFPLFPWLTAVGYRTLGEHEALGRALAWGCSILAFAAFLALARHLLPPVGAVAAGAIYAMNPLDVRMATAFQPEPMMMAGYLVGAYGFVRWLEGERPGWLGVSAAGTLLALLVKISSLHIGLLFLALVLRRDGLRGLARPALWAFAAVTLLPAVAWNLWSVRFWHLYGNSLGIANESHWIGWDFFTNSYFVTGIVRQELRWIWTPAGVVLGLAGVWLGRGQRARTYALLWLAVVFAFYVVASRTTADSWAWYYHIFTLPAAALLMGLGAQGAADLARRGTAQARLAAFAVGLAAVTVIGLSARQVARDVHPHPFQAFFACAERFAKLIPAQALVLASGGPCVDSTGRPVAYNASYMFYWMDRKGFSICQEQQSVDQVASFAAQGAAFFVAERAALAVRPGLEAELRARYPVAGECPKAILFRLKTSDPAS